jgi:hypothetical protein
MWNISGKIFYNLFNVNAMKNLILIFGFIWLGCTNAPHEHATKEDTHQHTDSVASLHLNNGSKWKTDEATRKNVTMIKQIVNESNYYKKDTESFTRELQTGIDTLVQQCRMTGPDHEALHLWLGNVLRDLDAVKKDKKENAFTDLRKDVMLFDSYFQ